MSELQGQQLTSPVSMQFKQNKSDSETICIKCKLEFNKLFESGLCWACKKESDEIEDKKRVVQDRLNKVLGKDSLPYTRFTFENFKISNGNHEAFDACKRFNIETDNLYLWGACGTGKTHLATAAWRAQIEKGHTGSILNPQEFNRLLRGREPEREEAIIRQIAGYQVLFLDELGLRDLSEAMYGWYYEIFTMRANSFRNGLIVTSNLSLDDFARKINDDRLPSRIACLCVQIKVSGQDFRLGKN